MLRRQDLADDFAIPPVPSPPNAVGFTRPSTAPKILSIGHPTYAGLLRDLSGGW